ncbi:hypothetical protein [Tsukamurella pseudospumae]|nr:hypothetical protein [Tsukamurella pseudospumae]
MTDALLASVLALATFYGIRWLHDFFQRINARPAEELERED